MFHSRTTLTKKKYLCHPLYTFRSIKHLVYLPLWIIASESFVFENVTDQSWPPHHDWIVRTILIENAFWLAKMASSSGTNITARRGKLVRAIDWRLVKQKSIVQTYWTSSYFVIMRKMNKSNSHKRLPLKHEKFIGQIATSVNWKQEIGSIRAAAKSFKHFRYPKRRLRQISIYRKAPEKLSWLFTDSICGRDSQLE